MLLSSFLVIPFFGSFRLDQLSYIWQQTRVPDCVVRRSGLLEIHSSFTFVHAEFFS